MLQAIGEKHDVNGEKYKMCMVDAVLRRVHIADGVCEKEGTNAVCWRGEYC